MSGGALATKLGAVTLAAALTGGALLAVRQRRILAAHDLLETHARVVKHDKALLRIRADIGRMSSPSRVTAMASGLGPMRPTAMPMEKPGPSMPALAGMPGLAEAPVALPRASPVEPGGEATYTMTPSSGGDDR